MTAPQPHLSPGDTGEWVLRLQTRLHALGRLDGVYDGTFDDSTHAAVIALQESSGLLTDGVVDDGTWAALERAELDAGLADPFASAAGGSAFAPAATPVGTLSEDLNWRWDGEAWQANEAAAVVAGDENHANPAGHLSADRQWLWDGSRWQPVTPEEGHV